MADDSTRLPAGKLPAELLASLLPTLPNPDPRVIIGPRVGTDAAALDMGDSVIIVKSDPITFATDDAGWYLVNVNANDIACMGGVPKWLLVTALLPEHSTTPELVTGLFESLSGACEALGISLIGGHTEITIGLDRPILIGSMLGETTREMLVDPTSVQQGDALLLCKGVAIEGTALLAREAPAERLAGVCNRTLDTARSFLQYPGISIVSAAQELRACGATVRALHDPTEGGLATALREIAAATGLGLRVNLDQVHIYDETREICRSLGIDPLGLIASGALLAAVSPDDAVRAIEHLQSNGLACAVIGEFVEPSAGVTATESGEPAELPEFEVDEIARFFASA